MIYLLCPGSSEAAANVVSAAFVRSCGQGQVYRISPTQWTWRIKHDLPGILVVINPPEAWSDLLDRTVQGSSYSLRQVAFDLIWRGC